MNLSALIPELKLSSCLNDLEVGSIHIDSRDVKEGGIFFALKGQNFDGNDYIDEALENGACLVVTDTGKYKTSEKIIYFKRLRENLSDIASRFYENPSANLKTICVTGTNGKTTAVETFAMLGNLLGEKSSFMSTINFSINGSIQHTSDLTTPDTITINRNLSHSLRKKSKYFSMEASSHGLEQDRLQGLEIDYAVLTSFSHDHLDYHGNLESYKLAKKKLFVNHNPQTNIVCIDSEFGSELFAELKKLNPNTYSVSIEKDADFSAQFVVCNEGLNVRLKALEKEISFELKTISRYLASNYICMMAIMILEGKSLEILKTQSEKIKFPSGRLQKIHQGNPAIYIDYAHTPEALEFTLKEIKNSHTGELWCLFGCGGDRDIKKRPIMGSIAEKYSDMIVLTSDNPRSENPDKIIKDITLGISDQKKLMINTDRKKAIIETFNILKNKEDYVLLIAGKGHESYQEIQGQFHEFSDTEIVNSILQ